MTLIISNDNITSNRTAYTARLLPGNKVLSGTRGAHEVPGIRHSVCR